MKARSQFIWIGLLGASAVALGALGAHALRKHLETGLMNADLLNGFDAAARYQIYHTMVMTLVVLAEGKLPEKFLKWSWYFFLSGIILFSGSLYLLTTRHILGMESLTVLGPVTPIGGLCFIAGWLSLVMGAVMKEK